MKIIHVYDGHERVFPGEGSVPSVVYQIAKYTAKKGYDVTVLERRWVGTKYKEEIDGIKFVRFDLNICSNISNREVVYDLVKRPSGVTRFVLDRSVFALKAYKYLKQNDFDVIHVHLPFAANILVNLNKKLRDKMVYTVHVGQEELRLPQIIKVKAKAKDTTDIILSILFKVYSPDLYLMKYVKKITVMHNNLADKLVEYGFNKSKIHVIPHGIDLEEFDTISISKLEEVRRRYIDESKVNILFATTITPHKGVIPLVKAINMLVNKYKLNNIYLILSGRTDINPKFVEIVKQFINKNNLNKNIIITGFLSYEDLKALYQLSDIFVYPLLGYGGVAVCILEAMAARLPIVATNIGGLPMQVIDGFNGFLVDPINEKQLVEQLVDRIRFLVENEEIRRKMGENSRKLVKEKFSREKIVKKYIQVYKEVVQ